MILSQFQTVGRDLFTRGLVSSHSGNLSIRLGEKLCITHRQSMLGNLQQQDLVETGINKNDRCTPWASTELLVHRTIYQRTSAQAVVHAHPPYTVALSFNQTEIVPSDMEGKLLLPRVPVLVPDVANFRPGCLAEQIAETLKSSLIVVVRGHGTFAIGQLLEEAYHYTTTLEESCRLLYLLRSLGSSAPSTSPLQATK
ncbi:MAG: aldolase [Dehalococcoidia bacterium]|nr:aldolase [Dehalococcoidia bacterium]